MSVVLKRMTATGQRDIQANSKSVVEQIRKAMDAQRKLT
jgi:hypothetical protein